MSDRLSHVADEEAQAVADYAVDVGLALGLPTWKFLVMEESAEEGANASIDPMDGYYVARLYLGAQWMDLDYDNRREIITHEVCHLLHYRINHVIDDARDLMHDHEHDALYRRYQREVEYMVDHIARFFASTHRLEQAWDRAHGKGDADDR